ncbi:MAG TPA: TVP38/TMEM64 family protein [Capillimicrobium sp.]|nr:TVP38/TMEM64 family protein [Capillimicrobium sp.]
MAVSGTLSAGRVRDWVDGFGVAGPLVFVAVAALLGCAFFPGPLLAGASGLLFGVAVGTPTAICSAVLTATLSCATSRFVAGDAVAELGGRRVRALAALVERRAFLSVLYVRLLPGVPFALFNYAAGLTRIPIATFAAATALGTAPRTFAYVALGGSFGDLGRPETIVAIAILVAMGLGGLIALRLTPPGPGRGSSSPDGRSAAPR